MEQLLMEQLSPDQPTAMSHKFRYYLARGFLNKNDVVLDMACGCGYGTEILSDVAKTVVGFDKDGKILGHARIRHKKFNNSFATIDLNDANMALPFDVAVSFETIEHLSNFRNHVENLKKARRLIIMSAPIIPTVGINPHHKHDFTFEQIRDLIVDDNWRMYQGVKQDFSHEHGTYGIFVFERK